MEIKFDFTRKFGVEIEFNEMAVSKSQLASLIRAKGIECREEGYNHSTRSHWKIITDSSCGLELVSPPMIGQDGFNQIEIVCQVLNEVGAKVDKRCGLHVHHDASDLTINNFKNLYKIYSKYENGIDYLQPESRRKNNNTYCYSISANDLALIEKATTIYQIANDILSGKRFYKLNVQSYLRHGTVEFRQHSGTTDAQKIINWVMLTNLIVVKSFEKIPSTKLNTEEKHVWYYMKKMLGLYYTEDANKIQLRKFFDSRYKTLNKNILAA
jgi:hypothetical protein